MPPGYQDNSTRISANGDLSAGEHEEMTNEMWALKDRRKSENASPDALVRQHHTPSDLALPSRPRAMATVSPPDIALIWTEQAPQERQYRELAHGAG